MIESMILKLNHKNTSLLMNFLLIAVMGLIILYGWPLFEPASETVKPIAQADQAPTKSLPETKPVIQETLDFVANAHSNPDLSPVTTEAIWNNLLSDFLEGKKVQIPLENALIERLRKEPGTAIYQELLSLFRQGGLPDFAQQVLVSILGEVGNVHSAETLMSLINEKLVQDRDVELAAFQAISKYSPELWQEHPNTEFAPVFEAGWQTDNADYWQPIANVMASIGTPSSLDIFIETLTENTNPDRVNIVKEAMTNLVNPALVPRLADLLENSTVENVQAASGNALANMGELSAATELFDWSTQADAVKNDQVRLWFETATETTPEFIDFLDKNLAATKFANPQIKQTIGVVLKNVQVEEQ
jgi:hypothetical protein